MDPIVRPSMVDDQNRSTKLLTMPFPAPGLAYGQDSGPGTPRRRAGPGGRAAPILPSLRLGGGELAEGDDLAILDLVDERRSARELADVVELDGLRDALEVNGAEELVDRLAVGLAVLDRHDEGGRGV